MVASAGAYGYGRPSAHTDSRSNGGTIPVERRRTPELGEAILVGMTKQLEADGALVPGAQGVACQLAEDHPHHGREQGYYCDPGEFWDDITGVKLDAEKVRKARELELEFVDKKPIYIEADVDECWARTGKKPISTRWVDIDKGGGEHRSRWVARDFKTEATTEYFAATPPWEAVKFLVSLLASQGQPSEKSVRNITKGQRRAIRDMPSIRRMIEAGGSNWTSST